MANEFYRQSIHLAVGVVAALGTLLVPKTTYLWVVGFIVVLASVFMSYMLRNIKWLFHILERDHAAFRGKGAMFFGLGVWLTALLFWENAAMAILLLAIPDALATMIGTMFKRGALPYNHRKSYLGSSVFFVSASIVLSVKYQELSIFFIAFLLTALESFDYREIPFLDDNLVIPLVAGYLLGYL